MINEGTDEKENLKKLRKEIFLTSYRAGTGHMASAYSSLEILYTLYLRGCLHNTPDDIKNPDRDKFILSKGHGSLALYCILAEAGFFPKEELKRFAQPDGILGGEPHKLELPGVEASTGSLGHGLPLGVGMAYADKLSGRRSKTYVLIGDGESEEGSVWEAVMTAAKYRLDHLIVIMDCNKIQKMSNVDETIGITSWDEKWAAFGWNVVHVPGHEVEELYRCFRELPMQGKPNIVIADTIKGHGVHVMENNPIWHWKQPNRKELKRIAEELEITQEELNDAKSVH
jgi:transketolase domain protein